MKINQLDINEDYQKNNPEAERLRNLGLSFITDWTFFPTMGFEKFLKESTNLIEDFKSRGYRDLTIHFESAQCIYIWGCKK